MRRTNGKEIEVTEHPVHNGNMWDWKIDSQVFDTDDYIRWMRSSGKEEKR